MSVKSGEHLSAKTTMMISLGDVSRCEITRPKAMVIQKILTYVTQFLSQEAVWVPAPQCYFSVYTHCLGSKIPSCILSFIFFLKRFLVSDPALLRALMFDFAGCVFSVLKTSDPYAMFPILVFPTCLPLVLMVFLV